MKYIVSIGDGIGADLIIRVNEGQADLIRYLIDADAFDANTAVTIVEEKAIVDFSED